MHLPRTVPDSHTSPTRIEAVLREHGPMLTRIAASYAHDAGHRSDLLQVICIGIWQALPRWRGEASLRSFLARVAHNRALDHLASQKRFQTEELAEDWTDSGDGPLEQAQRDQQRLALIDAVRRLPLGMRQVVVLALEGFSQSEIGQAMDLAENTVAQRLSRARRILQQGMESAS